MNTFILLFTCALCVAKIACSTQVEASMRRNTNLLAQQLQDFIDDYEGDMAPIDFRNDRRGMVLIEADWFHFGDDNSSQDAHDHQVN